MPKSRLQDGSFFEKFCVSEVVIVQGGVKGVTSHKTDLLVTFKPRKQLLEDVVLFADPADELLEFPIDVQG